MSNISSIDTEPVEIMRWGAWFLTILWAIWVVYWTFLLVLYQSIEQIITLIIAFLLFAGTALVASALRKEALGGGLLLLAGLLTIISFTHGPHSPLLIGGRHYLVEGKFLKVLRTLAEEPPIYLPLFMMALPPLVAGALFLICHWRSEKSAVITSAKEG